MIKYLQIIFSLLLISSCTFEPDGLNYVEIEKPADTHPMEVTLSIDRDSIYIYKETKFVCKINTFGKGLNYAVVKYQGQEFVISENASEFSFIVNSSGTNYWFDLTIRFYASTESGSIADRFRLENYVMSRTWKVQYIDLNNSRVEAGHKIHPDGYLELFMIKPPQLEGGQFKMYKYSSGINPTRESGDTLFFADKRYTNGLVTYNLTFEYDDSNHKLFLKEVTVNYPQVVLKTEAHGIDSCKITWTKSPFKLYYIIYNHYSGYENEVIVPIPINQQRYYSLNVYSPEYKNNDSPNYSISSAFMQGTSANYKLCYSVDKNQFYILKDDYSAIIKAITTPLPNDSEYKNYNSYLNIFCSPNGKYFAAHLYSNIYVYRENLSFWKEIPITRLYYTFKTYAAVTNDGAYTFQDGNTIHVQNISESTSWNSFSFKTDLESAYNVVHMSILANSIDGKYICVRGLNGLKIFDVSNHQTANVVYTHPDKSVQSLAAHPTNPELLYVVENNELQLRKYADFKIVKTIDIELTDYKIYTIDPYSGILMLCKNDDLYFHDPDTGRKLFQLKSSEIWTQHALLVRNILKTKQNYIDLTQYLQK